MYENYWNLREKPFRNLTDKKFFFYAKTYEEAYLRLLYSVNEPQGLFLLQGDSGCGKTFLCKIFLQDILEQGYRAALISNPTFSPTELLQQVLYGFGIEAAGKTKLELLQEFKKLAESAPERSYVLLIDEAHLIQDLKTIEEIRLLLNLEVNNRYLIIPILVGKPELGEIIGKTSLKDRVALQHWIAPLTCRETGEYIYSRMNKAGCAREIFTAEAIKEIHAVTGGIPREINCISDVALLLGYGENAIVVDRNLVLKALHDVKGSKTKS